LGWRCVGEPVDHFGQPHQLMQASLAARKTNKRQQPQETEPVYA
jgi:hypothetical protein